MNRTSKRFTLTAAAAAGMLGLLSATAQAETTDPGKPVRTYTEERTNPVTGEKETATITEYPDVIKRGNGGTSNKPTRSYTTDTNPITGQREKTTVTEYPGTVKRPSVPSGTTAPAPGTGGLFLRDADGSVKGLMGEGDRARIIACHPSNPNLVKVEQTTSGHSGWGPYVGYVKIAATSDPSRIACG
ncbi:hypothetical protein [Streptomyces violascens]|uniref:hypothetical protein n=1 Tax=Streptomyces violascens TaxID=67381 RepID=UPI001674C137|nr:hypothetical protein [Streptomyces violascens]GGU49692.1 hypothetical protein GCM10010289_82800 [Streptomyces violascens]